MSEEKCAESARVDHVKKWEKDNINNHHMSEEKCAESARIL